MYLDTERIEVIMASVVGYKLIRDRKDTEACFFEDHFSRLIGSHLAFACILILSSLYQDVVKASCLSLDSPLVFSVMPGCALALHKAAKRV